MISSLLCVTVTVTKLSHNYVRNGNVHKVSEKRVNHDDGNSETVNNVAKFRREVEQNCDCNHEIIHEAEVRREVEQNPNGKCENIHEVHSDDGREQEAEVSQSELNHHITQKKRILELEHHHSVLDYPGNVSDSEILIMSASNDSSNYVAWTRASASSISATYPLSIKFDHEIRPTKSVAEYAKDPMMSIQNAPDEQYDMILHGK